jgi:hypothetical protein
MHNVETTFFARVSTVAVVFSDFLNLVREHAEEPQMLRL